MYFITIVNGSNPSNAKHVASSYRLRHNSHRLSDTVQGWPVSLPGRERAMDIIVRRSLLTVEGLGFKAMLRSRHVPAEDVQYTWGFEFHSCVSRLSRRLALFWFNIMLTALLRKVHTTIGQ